MKIATTTFDAAEYLDGAESIAAFLEDAFETGDPVFISDAIGIVARSTGMTEIARKANLSRESLYKALSPSGNPQFAAIMRVMAAFGVRLTPTWPVGKDTGVEALIPGGPQV